MVAVGSRSGLDRQVLVIDVVIGLRQATAVGMLFISFWFVRSLFISCIFISNVSGLAFFLFFRLLSSLRFLYPPLHGTMLA